MAAEFSPALHVVSPLIESVPLSRRAGCQVLLKLDCTQPSGSYKLRGMGYLAQDACRRGRRHFVASSGGNAGLAVAWAARALGARATIVVPKSTPPIARAAIESLGAQVEVHGSVYAEADSRAKELAAGDGREYFSAYDDARLWAGHASLVTEVKRQLSELSQSETMRPRAVVVAVGGGGLLCGVCEGLKLVGWDTVPVVTMETNGSDCFARAVEAGKLVTLSSIDSVAKSLDAFGCSHATLKHAHVNLGASTAAAKTLEWVANHPGRIYPKRVSDAAAVDAVARFATDHRMLVEPACGASLAAVYHSTLWHSIDMTLPQSTGPILIVVCGGSMVTPAMLTEWQEAHPPPRL